MIPGFLWDPEKKKYFKETKELKEKLAQMSLQSKIEEEVAKQQRPLQKAILPSALFQRELIVSDCDRLWRKSDLCFRRLRETNTKRVLGSSVQSNILDVLFFEDNDHGPSNNNDDNSGEEVWVLLAGGVLIKHLIPPTFDDRGETLVQAHVQEMVAGLGQETSSLISTKIPTGHLVAALNLEKNVIRILPRESIDSLVPEIILKVNRAIAMNCCQFDADWNCVIGSRGSVHCLNWSNGGTTETRFHLNDGDTSSSKSDVISILCSSGRESGGDYTPNVFCGSRNGIVTLLDTRTKGQQASFQAGSYPVTCMRKQTSLMSEYILYSGHLNGEINRWDLRFASKPLFSLKSLNKIKPFSFHLVHLDSVILAANDSGLLEAWNTSSQDLERITCMPIPSHDTRPIIHWDSRNRGCWFASGEGTSLTLFQQRV